jgi:hypothetical protein
LPLACWFVVVGLHRSSALVSPVQRTNTFASLYLYYLKRRNMFPLLPLFRRPFGRPTYFQYDDSTLPPRLKQFITAPSYKINTE